MSDSYIVFNDTNYTIDEAISLLNKAKAAYYFDDNPIMSDAEFDHLENLVEVADPKNPYFETIGAEVVNGKVKLPITMGGLKQLRTDDAIYDFCIQYESVNNQPSFVVSEKLDGLSIQVVYRGGVLAGAYTRGNGTYGKDILRHVSKFKNIPKTINHTGYVVVRGEMIFSNSAFEKLRIDAENPRNYVAGCANRKETDQLFVDNVNTIMYDIIIDDEKFNKDEQLLKLKELGFDIPRYHIVDNRYITNVDLPTMLDNFKADTDFDLDGVVVEYNDLRYRSGLDSDLKPSYAFKFKINDETNLAVTQVLAVQWESSKYGYLKPVVLINPVRLKGVTISRASGMNAKFILENKIGPNAIVEITRSGDVIPYITQVLTPSPATNLLPSEPAHWSENHVDLILDNPSDDITVAVKSISSFFEAIDAPHIREGIVAQLMDHGFTTIASIVNASEEELGKAIGTQMGAKVYNGIRSALTDIPLTTLVGASQLLGRGVGSRKLDALEEAGVDILTASYDQVLNVKGFEKKTAEKITENMKDVHQFLADIGGKFTLATKPVATPSSGEVVCFTGVRPSNDLKAAIERSGAKIAASFNKKVTVLVAKTLDSTSSSMTEAKKNGIEIITHEEASSRWT